MIIRIWHGRTAAERADEYAAFLQRTAIPDYRVVPGNEGALVLRRAGTAGDEFLTVSLWTSLDAIRGFHGDDIEVAKYYEEDEEFLLEFEPTVVHYEVVEAQISDELCTGAGRVAASPSE
jgi:heme-degrading monooxygenase HmoA